MGINNQCVPRTHLLWVSFSFTGVTVQLLGDRHHLVCWSWWFSKLLVCTPSNVECECVCVFLCVSRACACVRVFTVDPAGCFEGGKALQYQVSHSHAKHKYTHAHIFLIIECVISTCTRMQNTSTLMHTYFLSLNCAFRNATVALPWNFLGGQQADWRANFFRIDQPRNSVREYR